MNYAQDFLDRKRQFNFEIKESILADLKEHCSKYGNWEYEDGYFSCFVEQVKSLFILKGDFEPYCFNMVAILPPHGYPSEEEAFNIEKISVIMDDFIEEQQQQQQQKSLHGNGE